MSDSNRADWQFLKRQLEQHLQQLVQALSALNFTQGEVARSNASRALLGTEQSLAALQRAADIGAQEELLIVEAHGLLAQARQRIAQVTPRRREGNVVEMRSLQGDLADAEFERLLAASDTPWYNPELVTATTPRQGGEAQSDGEERSGPALRLVYSAADSGQE